MKPLDLGEVYQVIEPGPVVLLTTRDKAGRANVMTMSWLMPIEFTDYNRRCAEQATARAVERANLSPLTIYAASREDSTEEVEAQATAGIHQASSGR